MPSTIRGSDNFDSLESQGLGDGQTWQDMAVSRAVGVTYTNTTGRPIAISIRSETTSTAVGLRLEVNGARIGAGFVERTGTVELTAHAIVPNGDTYKLEYANQGFDNWWELR